MAKNIIICSDGTGNSDISGFAVAYALALFTDRRMSALFSQFWHQVQPQLRRALTTRATVYESGGERKAGSYARHLQR